MNLKIRNTITIVLIYFLISLIAVLIFPPLMGIDNYINLLKEGLLFSIFIKTAYGLLMYLLFPIGILIKILVLILFIGNILPLIFIYKTKKLLPYIIISAIFYFIYIFIGILFTSIEWSMKNMN
jgi:hypothetical protein